MTELGAFLIAQTAAHSWWEDNWFNLVQTIGILVGLLVAAASLRADVRSRTREGEARKAETLMLTTQHHREIWGHMLEDPSLTRILDPTVDLDAEPLSEKERTFSTFLILHFLATYRASQAGVLYPVTWGDARDFAELLSFPIPAAVWTENRPYYEREFVSFVDDAIRTWGSEPTTTSLMVREAEVPPAGRAVPGL